MKLARIASRLGFTKPQSTISKTRQCRIGSVTKIANKVRGCYHWTPNSLRAVAIGKEEEDKRRRQSHNLGVLCGSKRPIEASFCKSLANFVFENHIERTNCQKLHKGIRQTCRQPLRAQLCSARAKVIP